jgi:hypothetical protein
MPTPLLTLWIDGQNNNLLAGWESQAIVTLPSLKQGDDVGIEIHLVSVSKGLSFMEEVDFEPNSTVKVAVGRNEQRPSTGYFIFGYNGDSVEVPYTTPITSTTQVPVSVNSLINGMPSIAAAGGVVVSIVNGFTYRFVFNETGARSEITCDSTNLRPTSTILNKKIVVGSLTAKEVQHIKPKVIPVAFQNNFVDSPAPAIQISFPSPAITRLSISPQPKYGSFVISNGSLTTGPIAIDATAEELLNELTLAGMNDISDTPVGSTYSVLKVGPFDWDISRVSGPTQTLSVSSTGLVGFKSKYGFLNLNNEEVEDILAGASSVSAIIEVEVSNSAGKHTAYQGPITIVNDLIDNQTFSPTQLPEVVTEAPKDGLQYARKDGSWHLVMLDGNNIPDYDNTIIYSVGNQVYYNGGLYRMILSGGVPDIDPALNPTHWESLSGGDLSNYVSKTGSNEMNIGSVIVFPSSFGTTSISQSGLGVFSANDINLSTLGDLGLQVTGANGTTQVFADGIAFPDSTVQTTAASPFDPTGYATETFVTSQGYITSSALTGYATQAWVGSNYAPIYHNHSIYNLTGWGGGQNQQYITSGSVLRVYNQNDTAAFLTPREVSRRKLVKSSLPPQSIVVQNTYYASTSGPSGIGNFEIVQMVTFSFSSNFLRLNTGYISTSSDGTTQFDNHYWTLGNNYSSPASEREYGGYSENFGDILNINLAANPSGTPSNGRTSGSYTADGITVSWETTVTLIDPDGYNNGVSYDGYIYPPTCSSGQLNFLQSEVILNSYIEPVMKGGVLGELTQELVGANSFSYTYNNSISKYSLIYDQSQNKWDFSETLDNSIIAKTTGATFTGKLTTAPASNFGNNYIEAGFRIPTAIGTPTYPLTGDIWLSSGGILNYMSNTTIASLPVTQLTNTFSAPQIIDTTSTTLAGLRLTQKGTAPALVIEDGTPATPDTSAFVVNANGAVGVQVNPATWTPATAVVFEANGRSVLNPLNIQTPSLNLGATACNSAPASVRDGDIWITNVASPKLAYRTGGVNYYPAVANQFNTFTGGMAITGASVSSPQLAVTQTGQGVAVQITTQIGSGHALVVEDITSPDTSATVVNSAGAVGVGVDPATWTPTNKVEVVGAVKADSITFDGTAQFKVNSVSSSHGGGSNTNDLFISFNGSTYRIPMIFVSTP